MDTPICCDTSSTQSAVNSDDRCDAATTDLNGPAAKLDPTAMSVQIHSASQSDHQGSSVVEGMDSSSETHIHVQKNISMPDSASNSQSHTANNVDTVANVPMTSENTTIMSNSISAESSSHGGSSVSGADSNIRIKMLARVSLSEAHFRHQQRGEPDLTMDEKIDIAQKLLDESESKFLARFGNYLELDDLEYFRDSMDVYEVNFYVNQIRKSKGLNFQKNRVKNRRYEAMKDMMNKGEYFSEDEMKYREPFLYEQMVGQYLTDDDLQAKIDKSDLRFSTILLKHIDQLDENSRYAVTKDREEGQEEEEEESDEEEEEMEMEEEKQEGEKEGIPAAQREELKAEFLTIMQQKFLQGNDKTFDYSAVDNNEAYDDLTTMNIEAEEKYFDDA